MKCVRRTLTVTAVQRKMRTRNYSPLLNASEVTYGQTKIMAHHSPKRGDQIWGKKKRQNHFCETFITNLDGDSLTYKSLQNALQLRHSFNFFVSFPIYNTSHHILIRIAFRHYVPKMCFRILCATFGHYFAHEECDAAKSKNKMKIKQNEGESESI